MTGADLRGCVNDVENMRDVLVDLFGFPERDIAVVTDLDATKASLQSGLEGLVEGATAGDVLYFHFSGMARTYRTKTGTKPITETRSFARPTSIGPTLCATTGSVRFSTPWQAV